MTDGTEGDPVEVTCPECEAPLAPEARFCDECGVTIPRRGRRSPRRPDRSDPNRSDSNRSDSNRSERAEKVQARATLAKARDKVSKIRMLFGVLAILPAFLGGVGLLGLGPTPMVLGFCAQGALMIAGALFVPRQPFVWTLILAVVMTLVTVADFVTGGFSIGAAIEAFVSFSLWMALPQMKRAATVLAEQADDFDARHLTQRVTRDGVERSDARQRAQRRNQKAMGSQMRTVMVVALLSVGAAVVLGIVLFAVGRTESLDARTDLFEQRWTADDAESIRGMWIRDREQMLWPKVERLLRREGWDTDLPTLGERTVVFEGDSAAEVHWALEPRGTLKVSWVTANTQWRIDKIGFADLR